MIRNELPIGVILVMRAQAGPFSPGQIELLKTFAAQAVIAIENTRLFNETKEALEQQTAISEILRVISSSPSDVTPVLAAVAMRAARICEASDVRIFLVDGALIRAVAGFGDVPGANPGDLTLPIGREYVTGRCALDRAVIHVPDILAVADEY